MALQYNGFNFIRFKQYINQQKSNDLQRTDGTPLYAHPIDGWIIHALNSMPVKTVINKAIGEIINIQHGHDIVSSITVDQRSFPDLFEILNKCSTTLGIRVPHAMVRQDLVLFNAYTAGTDEYAFINIASGLCQFYSQEEAAFVLGHECGHIASGHIVYHTLANILTNTALGYTHSVLGPLNEILRFTAGVPLLAWSRRSEVTADRAGLLCCGDISVAERALIRLVAGLADPTRIDIDSYLERFNALHEYHHWSALQELFASHPMIPKRILALRLFANSELYYSLNGKPKPSGKLLTRQELDRKVSQIVRP